jgi:hypothetical protein
MNRIGMETAAGRKGVVSTAGSTEITGRKAVEHPVFGPIE